MPSLGHTATHKLH